jgi:hypothetical protein
LAKCLGNITVKAHGAARSRPHMLPGDNQGTLLWSPGRQLSGQTTERLDGRPPSRTSLALPPDEASPEFTQSARCHRALSESEDCLETMCGIRLHHDEDSCGNECRGNPDHRELIRRALSMLMNS